MFIESTNVSASVNQEEFVRNIEDHAEHHKRVTFQDEYDALLKPYGIEYDERYVGIEIARHELPITDAT